MSASAVAKANSETAYNGKFSLFGNIIFLNNLPVFKVVDPDYTPAIFKEFRKSELLRGADQTLIFGDRLATQVKIGWRLRRMTDLDIITFTLAVKTIETEKTLGNRLRCNDCNRNYYDLNQQFPCPICAKQAVVPANLQKVEPYYNFE